jgi:hypothetical protein
LTISGARTASDDAVPADIAQKFEETESGQVADDAKHDDHKDKGDGPNLHRELDQLQKAADTILANRIGHGSEGCERGQIHDELHDVEHALEQKVEEINQRCGLRAELSERRTENHSDQDDLKHVAADKRLCCTGRNDVEQERHDAQMLRARGIGADCGGVEFRRIDVHSPARLQEICGN